MEFRVNGFVYSQQAFENVFSLGLNSRHVLVETKNESGGWEKFPVVFRPYDEYQKGTDEALSS